MFKNDMQMNWFVIHTENHKQGSFNISSAFMTAMMNLWIYVHNSIGEPQYILMHTAAFNPCRVFSVFLKYYHNCLKRWNN